MKKERIKQYQLLKNTPMLKAGAIYTWNETDQLYRHTYFVDGEGWNDEYPESSITNKEWFTPVEEEVCEIMQIGYPSKKIRVYEDKVIVEESASVIDRDALQRLYKAFGDFPAYLGGLDSYIWIGCDQGTRISYKQLGNIIPVMNQLKNKSK